MEYVGMFIVMVFCFSQGKTVFINNELANFDTARSKCVLATPNVEYSANGIFVQLEPVDLDVDEGAWVGYVEEYEIFQFIGCATLDYLKETGDVSDAKAIQRDIGQCQSVCTDYEYFGVGIRDDERTECRCIKVADTTLMERSFIPCDTADKFTDEEFLFGLEETLAVYKIASTDVRNALKESSNWKTPGYNCTGLLIPRENIYGWGKCSSEIRVLCRSNVLGKHLSDVWTPSEDEFVSWKEATETCLKKDMYLIPFLNEEFTSSITLNPIWTSNIRTFVIRKVTEETGLSSSPTRYGYIKRTGDSGYTLHFGTGELKLKSLCISQSTQGTTPSTSPKSSSESSSELTSTSPKSSSESSSELTSTSPKSSSESSSELTSTSPKSSSALSSESTSTSPISSSASSSESTSTSPKSSSESSSESTSTSPKSSSESSSESTSTSPKSSSESSSELTSTSPKSSSALSSESTSTSPKSSSESSSELTSTSPKSSSALSSESTSTSPKSSSESSSESTSTSPKSSSESNINTTSREFSNSDVELNGDSNVAVFVSVPVVIVLLTCGGLVVLFFWRKRKGKQNQPTYVNQNSRILTDLGQTIEVESERRTQDPNNYDALGEGHEPNCEDYDTINDLTEFRAPRNRVSDRIYNVLDSNQMLEEEHTYRELETIAENKDTKNAGYDYVNVAGPR